MAERDEDWVPQPYVSGAARPRGEGSVFDPARTPGRVSGPRAFVTGWPVWHSRSPLIHRTWLDRLGLDGAYERRGVPPEEAAGFFAAFRAEGYAGGNVTAPHKQAAYEAAERRDAAAEAIGAVNTLWYEGGTLVGGNTDAHGFAANLDDGLPGWAGAETAVVLGAGGAARAVIHALVERGIGRVVIVNRTRDRAIALAERFGARVTAHDAEDRAARLAEADLVVNTVPIAEPGPDEAAAIAAGLPRPTPDLSMLKSDALVTDIVYVPLKTPILLAAEARGLATCDGLGMLLHQAAPGFERWFGHRPAVDADLRARIVADIESDA